MIRIWHIHGPDSSNDQGFWEAIVIAENRTKAIAAVKKVMRDNNRSSLATATIRCRTLGIFGEETRVILDTICNGSED